ncbi:hypothetical protein IOD14_35835 [Streptomyces sp. A2-16]|uniref:hypothetical protein n=2 Tax=unclassified Streptomyces TaxID=2593676 RepID=UPI000F504B97|nr:hypothetical protein [Streptomyces sp. A2-16]QUC61726.1 hypothetical protein IOD14_35835 [Streptomyces sp. A2-16]
MGVMPSGKQAASAPFTPLDFQLVLLRRMADHNPGLVEDARHTLGVSIADMREANKRWQAMVRSPPRSNELARGHPHRARAAVSRYRSVLGAPETVLTRKVGELECEAWLWPVPLWPDLRFEALLAPNGSTVWNEWLVRAPEAEGPDLRTLEDLTPWSCTVDEAARAFPPARPLEGTAPTRWGLTFTAPDQQGAHREVTAEFTWGLLQRLTVR